MRSDHIRAIFSAFVNNDKDGFLEVANDIIQHEEKMNHRIIARDLKDIVKSISNGKRLNDKLINKRYKDALPIPRDSDKGFPLIEIKEFDYTWDDLVLESDVKDDLKQILNENLNSDLLSSYGLKPKQKILFCGPPGTGKTLSSWVISSQIMYPLAYIRFDSIVSSFLGETAANLKKIFAFIEQGRWVVLFDEFDIIGKHRDDPYEHGEIKRIVNNFMQLLDNYQGESILIAATNHQNLLDSALWRRFDDIVSFNLPDKALRKNLFSKYLRVLKKNQDINFKKLAEISDKYSPADIAQICWRALKSNIIKGRNEISTEDLISTISKFNRKKQFEGLRNERKV